MQRLRLGECHSKRRVASNRETAGNDETDEHTGAGLAMTGDAFLLKVRRLGRGILTSLAISLLRVEVCETVEVGVRLGVIFV